MFYVWLVEQSSSLEPGYSEFRLLFAVDSVLSVVLKDFVKGFVCGSSRYGREYADTLLLKTSID
jgi:hypothetical protein